MEPIVRKSIHERWLRHIASGLKTFEGRLDAGFWGKLRKGDRFVAFSAERELDLAVTGVRRFPDFRAAVAALGDALIPRGELLAGGELINGDTYEDAAAAVYSKIYGEDPGPVVAVGVAVVADETPTETPAAEAPAAEPATEPAAETPAAEPLGTSPGPTAARQPRLSRNSTSFMQLATERLRGASYPGLYPHQARTVKYVTDPAMRSGNPNVDGRGLLVTDEMGTGKGITMAAVVHHLNMPTVLLTTRPLIEEFARSVKVFEKVSGATMPWHLIRSASMNASNTALQISRAIDGVRAPLLEDARANDRAAMLRAATTTEAKEDTRAHFAASVELMSFNDIAIVVDEAHLLARAVSNGSANASAIYRAIKRSPRARVFLFTGTPGVDDPFELGLLYNMVGPAAAPPFPETYIEFDRYFVDRVGLVPRNPAKWMNRISGLQADHRADGQELPVLFPLKMHYVAMADAQYEEYALARERELAEDSKGGKTDNAPAAFQRPKGSRASTYRVRSRQAGDSFRPKGGELRSTKAEALLDYVEGHPSRLVLVYTQFVERGDRAIVAAARRRGWTALGEPAGTHRFASINGGVSQEEQARVIAAANLPGNHHGAQLRLVIVSVVAAVGLNFFWGSDVFLFEPYWNKALHDQIIARVRRAKSLPGVPPDQRHIQPHIMFAVPPKSRRLSAADAQKLFARKSARTLAPDDEKRRAAALAYADRFGLPTDISLYLGGLTSATLLARCRELGAQAGIGAVIEKVPGARLCRPTGDTLFLPDVDRDLRRPDPCLTYEKTVVKAEKIVLDGATFFYAPNPLSPFGVDLFQKNDSGENFVSVVEDEPAFRMFLEKWGELGLGKT